jgi:hypothetical protein
MAAIAEVIASAFAAECPRPARLKDADIVAAPIEGSVAASSPRRLTTPQR